MITIEFEIPVRTYPNPRGRTWRAQYGALNKVRAATVTHCLVKLGVRRTAELRAEIRAGQRFAVTLTRIGPRACDEHDNLRTALKPVVDVVGDWLIPGLRPGRSDGDPRLEWRYGPHEKGPFAVRVSIQRACSND